MEPWHLWTILGISLVIVEMLTVSFFAASFGVAALVTAAIAARTGCGTTMQLAAFSGASVVSLAIVRPLFRGLYRASDNRPVLTDAMIGGTGTVVDEIEAQGGHGRVRVGAEEWRAVAPDHRAVPAGARVEILKVDGATLTVRPI